MFNVCTNMQLDVVREISLENCNLFVVTMHIVTCVLSCDLCRYTLWSIKNVPL